MVGRGGYETVVRSKTYTERLQEFMGTPVHDWSAVSKRTPQILAPPFGEMEGACYEGEPKRVWTSGGSSSY